MILIKSVGNHLVRARGHLSSAHYPLELKPDESRNEYILEREHGREKIKYAKWTKKTRLICWPNANFFFFLRSSLCVTTVTPPGCVNPVINHGIRFFVSELSFYYGPFFEHYDISYCFDCDWKQWNIFSRGRGPRVCNSTEIMSGTIFSRRGT